MGSGNHLDPVHSLGNKYNLNSKNVISSSYWKVPDSKTNLTSVACHETDPLIAVASGSRDSNLFIYEVGASSVQSNKSSSDTASPTSSTSTLYDSDSHSDDSNFPRKIKPFIPTDGSSPSKHSHHSTSRRAVSENLSFAKQSSHNTTTTTRSSKHRHSASTASDFSLSSSSTLSSSSSYTRPLNKSPILIHHQTISLSGIHSLAWVPAKHKLSDYGNVLATGHSGIVHLVMLPDPYANNGPAEILSRFNHTRHLPADQITSSRIRSLNIAGSTWRCCPESSIISLFSERLFLWDPSRGDIPIVKQKTRKARSLHASPIRNGIVSLATERGISIMDIRYKNPAPLAPPTANDGVVSLVKWSPIDENRVASVHDQNIIKIWDIRAGAPLMTLDGHYDMVNSIDWSSTNSNEFFSASSDGTVRLWDLQKYADLDVNDDAALTAAAASTNVKDTSGDWLPSNNWRLYRQRLARENSSPSYSYFLDNIQNPKSPCTTIFSNKKEYLALGTVQLPLGALTNSNSTTTVPQMITIDNEGFFGLHSRIPEESLEKDEKDSKTPYSHAINRNSLESLASATSKGTGDSDGNIDDSLSDTSVSASSPIPSEALSVVVDSIAIPQEQNTHTISSVGIYDESGAPTAFKAFPNTTERKKTRKSSSESRRHTFTPGDVAEKSADKNCQNAYQSNFGPASFDYSTSVQPLNVVKSRQNPPPIRQSHRSVSGPTYGYKSAPPKPSHKSRVSLPYNEPETEPEQLGSYTLDPRRRSQYDQYGIPGITPESLAIQKKRLYRHSQLPKCDFEAIEC